MLPERETASGFGFSTHNVDMTRARQKSCVGCVKDVYVNDLVLNYHTARGDNICSIAIPWIQATVPAAWLLECCILCNAHFYTTSTSTVAKIS